MKVSFADNYLEQLYQGVSNRKPKYQPSVIKQFRKVIRALQTASSIEQLKQFRSLNFEPLTGNLKGYHSVRVNRKYRLILTVINNEVQVDQVGEEALIIEQMSNHYQ